MNKIFYICLIFTSLTFAQYIPTYVESSTGLNNPSWDGGRTELEFADVNNDGNLDMLSIGDHGSPFINTNQHGIMVWFGDGTGNWSVFQFGNFGYGGIAVGDVNNDGLLDVGYGMHHNYSGTDLGNQLIEVALGDGTGTIWTAWDDGLATNGESWGMFCTDFADIDNDGDLDIGANSFGSGSGVHVYLNQGDGSWVQSFGFLGGNSTMDFVFGDVNNDGFPDIAVAQQNGTVYLNDGSGNFIPADGNLPPGSSILRSGPDLGDIDNDGTNELSFANSNGGVEVWKWSDGNMWTLLSNGLPAGGGYDMTQLFDINMDGFVDVAAFGSGVITTWLGDGTGNWTQAAQFTLPSPGSSQAFRIDGDADHNGYPDIALVDEEGSWPSYQNHLRFFKEDSPADSLKITALAPGSYRRWNILSVQFIRWISEVPAGDSSRVKLEISLNDMNGPWQLITNNLPNNGHYQWIVPGTMASANICRIRYTVYTLTDSTSTVTPTGFYISPDLIPVELISFTAEVVNNDVELAWQTATETNNWGFEILRSYLSSPFDKGGEQEVEEKIGFVDGKGTTTEITRYSYEDILDKPGRYQYRLKQIDYDGSYNYSYIVEVEVNVLDEFSLHQNYPNPFNPSTMIRYEIPGQVDNMLVVLKVYDVLGNEVATIVNEEKPAGNYEVEFDGNSLPSGVYFYRLTVGKFADAKKLILLK